jgi:hypothetical protein
MPYLVAVIHRGIQGTSGRPSLFWGRIGVGAGVSMSSKRIFDAGGVSIACGDGEL